MDRVLRGWYMGLLSMHLVWGLVMRLRIWGILPSWQVVCARFQVDDLVDLSEDAGASHYWFASEDAARQFAAGFVQGGLDEGVLWLAAVGRVEEIDAAGWFWTTNSCWCLPKGYQVVHEDDDTVVRRS